MKFLLTAILISAYSNPVLAVEEILNGLNSINTTEMDCSTMKDSELATQCAHEVCGEPKKKSIKIKAEDAANYLTPTNFKKLQNLERELTNYYAAQKEDLAKLADEFKKRKEAPRFQDLSNWKDEDFNPFIDYFFEKIIIDVDFLQPPEKRMAKLLTPKEDQNFLLHQEIIKNFDISKDPLRALNIGAITEEEFKKLILIQSRDYQSKLMTLKKKSNFSETHFSFQINSGINDRAALIKLYQTMKDEALVDGIDLVPNLCLDQCKREIVKLIKETNPQKIKKNAEDALTSLTIADRVAMCKGAFLSAHIENTKRDEFAKMWPGIKKDFEANLFPRFSDHSKKLLTKYLNEDLNFFFSDPFRTKFSDIQNSLQVSNASYSTMANNQLAAKAILLAEEGNPFRQDCPLERKTAKVWDVFASKEFIANNPTFRPEGLITNQDNISISPFACEHQGEGRGIIAHEVGHALSHVMARPGMSKGSAKTYLNLRKCVTAKWKDNPKYQLIYHKGDKLYTEEDTADLISYMAIKDASSPYGCVLLYPNDTEYSALGTSPVFGDNHTPGMIRLLRELQYKAPERIPATCAELIKRHPDKMGKKCI